MILLKLKEEINKMTQTSKRRVDLTRDAKTSR